MNLFQNIEELTLKVESILKEEKFSNTLLFNFAETIEEYIRFIEKYNSINLNNY